SGGSLALAFCTARHNHDLFLQGVRDTTGEMPVLGGAAIGVLTEDNLGYEGAQAAVAILPDFLKCEIASAGGLDLDEAQTGRELGKQLASRRHDDEQVALLFYDSVRSAPPPAPVLNVSSRLLSGFEETIGSPPEVVGAGLVGSYGFPSGKVYCGDRAEAQHATAALLRGQFVVRTSIFHGCVPMSDYHVITRIEGNMLYEIDGCPAVDVVNRLLGGDEWQNYLPLLLVTLGVNHGEKYGPYIEGNYVNRLIVGVVPERKALVLFEADFEEGMEFQFMRRSPELMEESTEKGCRAALADFDASGISPSFALYIDCAGRTVSFSGGRREEAAIVQQIVGDRVPLLGFYSGVEISRLLGRNRGLDWTGALMIVGRKDLQ
ncbi:FIST C-terminal domain-containing protein, partial [bacterium]|nr:FIST C-terminal domain-containing protein [bacterium]